jgi:hypothetical protein
VLRAADAAARWHLHQRRKGTAQEPYINHVLEVASLVAAATYGQDPELVIAALLHDANEDQEVPSELIAREFGDRVAAIVAEVTDNKSLDKAERKRLQVELAPKKTDAANSSSSPTRRATCARSRLPLSRLVCWTQARIYRLGQEGCPGLAQRLFVARRAIRSRRRGC